MLVLFDLGFLGCLTTAVPRSVSNSWRFLGRGARQRLSACLAARGAGSRRQPERRVPVGDQDERVGGDPVVPAEYAFDEAEYVTGITAGEQDREPGHDHREERGDFQE